MPLLMEPKLQGVLPGTPAWFETQRNLIKERPLLKRCYDLWYQTMLSDEKTVPSERLGVLLELGSGSSYIKDLEPRVITSDVTEGLADRVVDGRHLPFEASSVRALFLTHAFHHIPDVSAFLKEAQRVLVPGGVVSMIEVAHTPLAKFFFSNFHPEPYDDKAEEWIFNQLHAMNDSNQALSWNVFFRDREKFQKEFPGLTLERWGYLPWLSYLLSGGVTRKNLIPGFLTAPIGVMDFLIRPLDPLLAFHWHLTLRKQER